MAFPLSSPSYIVINIYVLRRDRDNNAWILVQSQLNSITRTCFFFLVNFSSLYLFREHGVDC